MLPPPKTPTTRPRTFSTGVCESAAIRLHQVHPGQELVRAVDTDEVLAGHAQKSGETGTGSDEHRVETFLVEQVVDGVCHADHCVRNELHAEIGELCDFELDDVVGESVFGDSVPEHTSELVECFEHRDVVSETSAVGGACKPGWAAADDGDAFAGSRAGMFSDGWLGMSASPVGDETFEVTDRDRTTLPSQHARPLALLLLWAHPPANCRERIVTGHDRGCCSPFALGHERNEFIDPDTDRAACDTRRVAALETPCRLQHRAFSGISEVDLVEVMATLVGRPFGHDLTRQLVALAFGERFAAHRLIDPGPT